MKSVIAAIAGDARSLDYSSCYIVNVQHRNTTWNSFPRLHRKVPMGRLTKRGSSPVDLFRSGSQNRDRLRSAGRCSAHDFPKSSDFRAQIF